MVLMDEEKARLEGEDCLPGEDAPITWDEDYMQGKEMRSLLYCSAQLCCVSLEAFSTPGSMCAKCACVKPRPHSVTESHGNPLQGLFQSFSREEPSLSLS